MRWLILLIPSLCFSQEFEPYFNGEKWDIPLIWEVQECPEYVETLIPVSLSDILPSTLTQEAVGRANVIITCSDTPPPQMLLKALTEGFDSAWALLGHAEWHWNVFTLKIRNCDIWLNTLELDENNAEMAIKHEFGHCLGLQHNPHPDSVMNAHPTTSDWHAVDRQQVEMLYFGCPQRSWVDKNLNNLKVVEYEGRLHQGILDAGKVWPDDIYNYSRC